MLRTTTAMTLAWLVAAAVIFTSVSMESVSGQELDPLQKEWIDHYQKQKNVPKLADTKVNEDAEPELTEGFTSLFNGKDLTGWNSKGGSCTFEVKDGHIVGTCVPGSNSTYLCTEKDDYSNFIFTCQIKFEVDGNTGVQFRSRTKPGKEPETVFGPQFEMEGQGKPGRNWSGGIYGQSCGGYFYPLWLKEHRAARAAEKLEGWNRLTISADGNVVKTWLNGVPASHWIDDGSYPRGFFGLQVHKGKAGTILFKEISVKEL